VSRAHRRKRSLPPRVVIVLALVVTVMSLAGGFSVVNRLSSGGFDAAGTSSADVSEILEREYGVSDPDVVVLVTARDGVVESGGARDFGRALTASLRALGPEVDSVTSYWDDEHVRSLRSSDGEQALIAVSLDGETDAKLSFLSELSERVTLTDDAAQARVGGSAEVFRVIQGQIVGDMVVAEGIAVTISMILLLLVFRSVGAALLPLTMGLMAASVTLLALNVVSRFAEVSIFAMNLTSALALGLGIDYGLLMVSRYREELAAGRSVEEAVQVTRATAGRTVLFSGLTVGLALGSLLVIPLPFLRSFAYAAIPVVLVSMATAIVVLPAILRLVGRRIDWLPLRRAPRISPSDDAFARVGRWSIRHRLVIAVVGIAGLCAIASSFLHVQIGKSDERVLRAEAPIRAVMGDISENFPENAAFPITVLVPRERVDAAGIETLTQQISQVDRIGLVQGPQGVWSQGQALGPAQPVTAGESEEHWRLTALLESGQDPYAVQTQQSVDRISDLVVGRDGIVGGETARLMDTTGVIGGRLPWVIGLIILTSLVLVFLLTGSVVVPIKAIVLNLLSLSATFGVMVWGFQDGNLAGLLGFTATGYLDNAMPALIFCAAFGLSMDYELFLVSRIHEEFLRTGDNDAAIVAGLRHTGSVFTSAALLLAVVFAGLIYSGVSLIQMAGLGIVLAIILDATLIRCFLVPSLMSLMGRANWWAPRPMRALHRRIGLRESALVPEPVDRPRHRIREEPIR
jgi:putative drug exporter of the RND superfamily